MRGSSAALALLLCAGVAAAHGVHDLRGQVRLDDDALRIAIESAAAHGERRACLRWLGELHVLDQDGTRLTGTEHEDGSRCRLDYPLASGTTALTLRLRPSPRSPGRTERLVLSGAEGAIVLTGRGNTETLARTGPGTIRENDRK